MAFWWGGLSFYALVVVPIGVDVLGGETEQGFITQRVSNIINLAGVGTLVILLWSMFTIWRDRGRIAKIGLAGSWIVMVITQAVLLAMHPRLDAMLDAQSHSINDPASFHSIHELYLTIVGVQWTAGLMHFVLILLRAEMISRTIR
jgi:hypothetical protein